MPHRSRGASGSASSNSRSPSVASAIRSPDEAEDLAVLSAAMHDMSDKFLAAEDWLGQVAERVHRLEAVLFRTPISNFLQIDKVIDDIVQKAHLAIHEEPDLSVLKVCTESQFGRSSAVAKDSVDDLFCTARDIGDELSRADCMVGNPLRSEVDQEGPSKSQQSCALSIGCISTDVGESNTDISVGNSSNVEPLRRAPSIKGGKMEHKHRVSDWREASDEGRCELDGSTCGDGRADIFQEIDQWSTLSSMLDPTWTEPVPRGLEVVEESSVPGNSSGSATPTTGCRASEMHQEYILVDRRSSEDDEPFPCSDRTPSPERQHDAVEEGIDDRGRMIAHLIAENARLQAQLSASPACSSSTGGALGNTEEGLEIHATTQSVKLRPRKLSKKERARRQRRDLARGEPQVEPS